jgi:hypothetical protein
MIDTDLIKRLRACMSDSLEWEAADEIERLRTGLRGAATVVRASADEIEKLRAQVVSLQSSLDAGPGHPGRKKTPDALEKP